MSVLGPLWDYWIDQLTTARIHDQYAADAACEQVIELRQDERIPCAFGYPGCTCPGRPEDLPDDSDTDRTD